MKLIVASTMDQRANLARQYPNDIVVRVGQQIRGLEFDSIDDRTHGAAVRTNLEWERHETWFQYARTGIRP